MTAAAIGRTACAALVLLLAGCATDVSKELAGNTQVREQVFSAIAGNGILAQQMTERLLVTDSLRTRVVETMLRDSPSAQYVLARIGHEPEAVDMVLQAAATDSVGRAHLLTLLKGIEIGSRRPK